MNDPHVVALFYNTSESLCVKKFIGKRSPCEYEAVSTHD